MTDDQRAVLSKVPAVTLGFWIIKILATTLGETGGDAVTMTWLGETTPEAGASGVSGYLIGTAIFLVPLIVLAIAQIMAKRFHPFLYWATIIASTTAGTTMADFATRSLGIGYTGGSLLLLACVIASLATWRAVVGRLSTDDIHTPRAEAFYWITITFSQTLGTALGDWAADDGGLGYLGGAAVFGGALAVLAGLYMTTRISRVVLFWLAFILTRPLGATVGDFLDKPFAKGGLDLSRPIASLVLTAAIVLLILILPQRAGTGPAPAQGDAA
ncbi:MAG: hypothetical protein J0I47_10425 [Sphingomonas sp.]|uniref:COG4705 family protein n=1 Tax=Sphingomonas sp. TaxID=28214 RepID=UPI001AC73B8D|nr:hypothetical protein [Sphingomonas sp.]MBN8808629.1 hypothetical protein [Sphingomonas sp.]